MDQLTITSEEVAQALRSIPHPEFRAVVWQLFRQGELSLIVESLIDSGKASDTAAAITYIAQYALTASNKATSKVTWGDIELISSNRTILRKLSELVKGKQISKYYDLTRYCGVIGHSAIPELFSGALIKFDRRAEHKFFWETFFEDQIAPRKVRKKPYRAGRLVERLLHHFV